MATNFKPNKKEHNFTHTDTSAPHTDRQTAPTRERGTKSDSQLTLPELSVSEGSTIERFLFFSLNLYESFGIFYFNLFVLVGFIPSAF